MDTLACPEMGLALAKPAADLDITLDETLDHWRGEADLSAKSLANQGIRLNAPGGNVTFAGNARETKGRITLSSDGFRMAKIRTGAAKLGGTYAAGTHRGSAYAKLAGNLRVQQLQLQPEKHVADLRTDSAGTHLEPPTAQPAAAD